MSGRPNGMPSEPAPRPAGSFAAGDAFAAVQAAVLAVWPQVRDADGGPTPAERNLMLDRCGSDHRPLLELVLELGHGLRPALAAQVGRALPAEAWATVRAAHVHRLVATRFLQPEVVRWAVDVWGLVLGATVPAAAVTTAPPTSPATGRTAAPPEPTGGPAPRSRGGSATAAPHPNTAPPRVPAARLGVPPSAVPPALRNVPSWAGGPVSFGVGATPKASTLATLAAHGRVVVQHGASGPIGPMWHPAEKRAAIVLAVLTVVTAVALRVALQNRQRADAAATVAAAMPARGPRNADSLGAIAATTSATASPPAAPSQTAPPAPDTPGAVAGPGEAVRARGVAGRYRVVSTVRSVDGSGNCDAVARALGAGRVSEEVVAHTPGDSAFAITTRSVRGVMAPDGWFVVQPRSGTTDNISWQFRLQGRFTADGFQGESETLTDAIIRWGRRQTCVVSADLQATRLTMGTE